MRAPDVATHRRAAEHGRARDRAADHRRHRRSSARTAAACRRCRCRAAPVARTSAHRLRSGLRVRRLESRHPLFSQARGALRYDEALATFVPDASPLPILPAGAANGRFDLADALADGHAAGLPPPRSGASRGMRSATRRKRAAAGRPAAAAVGVAAPHRSGEALRRPAERRHRRRHRARRARRLPSVEHLKRYTTLGMGTDQGKTSNISGLALLAEAIGRPDPRSRYDHVPPAVHAGDNGRACRPATAARTSSRRAIRRCTTGTSSTARASSMRGCGGARTPIRATGESPDDAAHREAKNVRANVGVVDVSTLGKIELQGRDVAEFLNRVYINRWDTLAVGRCRYGVMLRDDGMVARRRHDVASRRHALPDDHDDRQRGQGDAASRAPAAGRLAGARGLRRIGDRSMGGGGARRAAGRAKCSRGSSASTCPTRRFRSSRSANATCARRSGPIPARLFRISYSGELAYEIHVPADRGRAMWEAVIAAGAAVRHHALRHRGDEHAADREGPHRRRAEADGRTTADDLGMGKLVNAGKWCIGKPLLDRPGLTAGDRWQLVGLTALDGDDAARRQAGRRSRARATEPNAGSCDFVVLESQSRRVDRAGAARERPRASRRNALGGITARRSEGSGARRAALFHRSRRGALAWLNRAADVGSTDPGHYGAGQAA